MAHEVRKEKIGSKNHKLMRFFCITSASSILSFKIFYLVHTSSRWTILCIALKVCGEFSPFTRFLIREIDPLVGWSLLTILEAGSQRLTSSKRKKCEAKYQLNIHESIIPHEMNRTKDFWLLPNLILSSHWRILPPNCYENWRIIVHRTLTRRMIKLRMMVRTHLILYDIRKRQWKTTRIQFLKSSWVGYLSKYSVAYSPVFNVHIGLYGFFFLLPDATCGNWHFC